MPRFLALPIILLLCGPVAGQDIIDAATAGDLARVQALVAADPGVVAIGDARGCTALHFAVNGNASDIVNSLLDAGAELEARDEDGDTPLHWAACTEHLDMIDLLLDRGAAIDALNHGHATPLLYATQRRQYDVVERLVVRGADLEIANDYGRTPLIWNTREGGDLEMARLLLRLGAEVDALDRFEDSSLVLAAWRGFRDLVDLLLDAGARTDVRPGMADDLLVHATNMGLDRLYRRLVSDGVTIDVAPGDYSSILHKAAGGGSSLIIADLLARGAPIDAKDMYGWTPLHHAADRQRNDAVRVLLSGGAGRDLRSLSGHSPLSLAEARESADVIRTLTEGGHGASRRSFPRLTGVFFGQGDPPAAPAPFAPDIVASCWGEHGSVSFTRDGREAFWSGYTGIPDTGYNHSTVLTSRVVDGLWTPPAAASFLDEHLGDVPFIAPDGGRVFFLSRRPLEQGGPTDAEHIWIVERDGDGWGEPRPLPSCVNDMPQHWQVSAAANGNLYFSSRRPGPGTAGVYVSRPLDGVYTEPEYLGFAGDTPCIAPDESFLITAESYGRENVVRFRRDDGAWGGAISINGMFPGIGGICPKLSPDGRAFFFISQRTGNNTDYWVDAGFMAELRRRDAAAAAVDR